MHLALISAEYVEGNRWRLLVCAAARDGGVQVTGVIEIKLLLQAGFLNLN